MPLRPWIADRTMLQLPPLSPIQYDALAHAERILRPETFDALGWEPMPVKFEINLAWGKGSGKDFISKIILARAVYLLLCLRSPLSYFDMPLSERISVTNIAKSAPQARGVFFEPWVTMLKDSRWFRQRMDVKATTVEFEKRVVARSGHSSVGSQEGQNLLVACP